MVDVVVGVGMILPVVTIVTIAVARDVIDRVNGWRG